MKKIKFIEYEENIMMIKELFYEWLEKYVSVEQKMKNFKCPKEVVLDKGGFIFCQIW